MHIKKKKKKSSNEEWVVTDTDHKSTGKGVSSDMSLSIEVVFQLQLYCFDSKV